MDDFTYRHMLTPGLLSADPVQLGIGLLLALPVLIFWVLYELRDSPTGDKAKRDEYETETEQSGAFNVGDKVYLLECWDDDPTKCPEGYSIGIIQAKVGNETFDVYLLESTHYCDLDIEGRNYRAPAKRLRLVSED